jgi:hypothetical protein
MVQGQEVHNHPTTTVVAAAVVLVPREEIKNDTL